MVKRLVGWSTQSQLQSLSSRLMIVALAGVLGGCAGTPLGQSLQDSLSADSRWEQSTRSSGPGETPTPTVTANPTGSPTPTPIATPTAALELPGFSERVNLSASGTSDGAALGTTPSGSTPTSPITSTTHAGAAIAFVDLEKAPQLLQSYLADLAALGILTPAANTSAAQATFNPNGIITRREFARWLVNSNNQINRDRPTRQIRLAVETSEPAFQDIPKTDPDFGIIQGLAEAGLIPSRLSGDGNTNPTFRPSEPLTRETLLQWKVPMDVRQPLPAASIDAVKQAWGFQDASQINGAALRAVLADYQNGDQANIRRAFGYVTLLLPKKPVTRAEAAASLWYFGYQGEGRSAQQALQPPSPEASSTANPTASPASLDDR